MKKIIFLVLILVTSLIFVACTTEGPTDDGIQDGPVMEEDNTLDEGIDGTDDGFDEDVEDPDGGN